ncbi:MAG: PIN domain-containing protein [Oscillospiraceae bacterium]|nr:PIN domain-containing protein [Oscillospiraceae bacterium]
MKVLLDTNIIIDCLLEREPYFTHSKEVLRECLDGTTAGYMATHTVNDIFYIVHKIKPDLPSEDLVRAIVMFVKMLETVNLTAADVEAASILRFSDFEDALINQCAAKIKADYIITRNCKDFKYSTIRAITPQDFLNFSSKV